MCSYTLMQTADWDHHLIITMVLVILLEWSINLILKTICTKCWKAKGAWNGAKGKIMNYDVNKERSNTPCAITVLKNHELVHSFAFPFPHMRFIIVSINWMPNTIIPNTSDTVSGVPTQNIVVLNGFSITNNKMQLFLVYLFLKGSTCFGWFLHPSGAHNCMHRFRYCQPILLQAGILDEMELQFRLIHDTSLQQ